MSILSDMKMYGRFGFGLRRFLRDTVTLGQAEERIRRHLAQREEHFLRVVEKGVFGYKRSPYLPLFRIARCEFGDVEKMVRQRGLEKTLLVLRQAGIYISFEECKGRKPIVREGQVFPVRAHDFDNPYLKKHYSSESGGSTGAGTRVHHDLDYLAERAARDTVAYHAHGVLDAPSAVWRGVLPDGSGINTVLSAARRGRPPEKWFTPVSPQELDRSLLKFRVATQLTVLLGRAFGVALPWPERVPIDQAIRVARWASATVKQHGQCLVYAAASRALRVCLAARKEGLDLTGATFAIAGEPVTPAKVRGIQSSGARYLTTYGFSEAGRLGRGCCNPASSNDLHLLTDMFSVIAYDRPVPGQPDAMVPAFNVTCLLPSSPKILINAESDDYGILETRSCGCPLGELGWTTHVRDIRSFQKLTGEGVTMVGSDMMRIIEEVLPARFGGSLLDYQVMEEEDEDGLTRVSLVISPEIQIEDESLVIETVLDAMSQESVIAAGVRRVWSQTGTLRVKRARPKLSARGKLLPLYVAKRQGGYGD